MVCDKGKMFYKQVGIEFMYTPIDNASLSISEYPSSAAVHLKVPKMYTKKAKHTHSYN